MKVAIVGAGSVGIATKLILDKRKNDSILFEATNNIGGLLRDLTFEGNEFFAGCHYFTNKEEVYKFLPSAGLKSFGYSYGSYTDIFDEVYVSNEFAGPVISKETQLRMPRNVDSLDISIEEKLEEYPEFIKLNLQKWLSGIGIEINKMHQTSLLGLSALRVYLPNQIKEIAEMRAENPSASNFYGLLYVNHTHADLFFTPPDGFNSYLDANVLPKIIKDFKPKASIKIQKNGNNFSLQGDKVIGSFDKIIWTGNPNPILKCLKLPKLDSHNLKCKLLVGEINVDIPTPLYIQVFSKKSNILRVYVYKLKNKSCFTIEKIEDGESQADTLKFSKELLELFGIFASLNLKGEKNQNRYLLHTLNDYKSLLHLNQTILDTNLVSAGWHLYGRDAKIKFVVEQINNVQ